MREYLLVLKLLIINMFRRGSEKKSKSMWILYVIIGLSALIIAFSIGIGVYALATQFSDINILITYLFIITFFVVIFFSLFSMLSQLYFAKDTEFFFTLPIKPSAIYFAKLTIVYFVELLIVLFVLVPSLIMIGLGASLGPVYYITMFFAIFIIPMFPLVFTSIIAIPLMYVVSFLKSKTAFTSVLIILLFSGLIAGYMYFSISIQTSMTEQSEEGITAMMAAFEGAFKVWGYIFYPFLAFSRFATMTVSANTLTLSMIINISVFLGSAAVLFMLAILISNAVYRKGAAKNLENKINVNAKGENVHRSVIKSLMLMEWRELFRNPTYAFQCLSFIILGPVMLCIMMVMLTKTTGSGEESIDLSQYSWLISAAITLFFGVSTNVAAQTAATRQGGTFYYSKIIPVDYKTQVKSKLFLYSAISFTSIVLCSVVALIFSPIWWMPIILSAYLIPLSYSANCFAVYFDLRNPKLNWVTYTEAVKNNKNVTVNSLLNMGIAIVFIFGSFILNGIITVAINSVIALPLTFIILSIASILLSVLLHSMLFSNIERLYSRLP